MRGMTAAGRQVLRSPVRRERRAFPRFGENSMKIGENMERRMGGTGAAGQKGQKQVPLRRTD